MPVTDADREAARAFNADHGGCCDLALSKAFMRHRETAEQRGRREGMERAADFLADQDGHGEWQEAAAAIRTEVAKGE